MAQITIFDMTKFFVPLLCAWKGAVRTIHHFGPYHLVGHSSRLSVNAAGHGPFFYGTFGFVGTYGLVFAVWKCLVCLLSRIFDRRRNDPP